METTQQYGLVGKIVNHNDPFMGAEKVEVLGFYEVTTSDAKYYLVKFLEDQQTWLCYPEDLTEIK